MAVVFNVNCLRSCFDFQLLCSYFENQLLNFRALQLLSDSTASAAVLKFDWANSIVALELNCLGSRFEF